MLQVGHVLQGRYRVERMLGEGGMGSVYLARDTRLPRQWALKELSQGGASAEERAEAEAAFMAEAEILAGLNHPNLPRVVDFFPEGGRQYLVMDFVAGETLEKRLERSPLGLAEGLKIGRQICQVLDYLHSQPKPVIFRDLKPANVILTPEGTAMLVDFGIARVFRQGAQNDTRALGTPGYAAPEQYGRGQSDHRTDLYALGATLHHAWSGKDPSVQPFHFEAIARDDFPAALQQLLLRSLAMGPQDRFQSARDFGAALEGVERDLGRSGVLPSAPMTSVLQEAQVPILSVGQPSVVGQPVAGFQPALVRLGRVEWGGQLRGSVVLQGQHKGRLSSDSRWLKVEPRKVKGENSSVTIYVDTRRLDDGGQLAGLVRLEGSHLAPLRVEVEVAARRTPAWCWPASIFLFLWSFLPAVGLLATPLMFWAAASAPPRSRGGLSFLAWCATFLGLAWLAVAAVVVGLLHLDWKAWLRGSL